MPNSPALPSPIMHWFTTKWITGTRRNSNLGSGGTIQRCRSTGLLLSHSYPQKTNNSDHYRRFRPSTRAQASRLFPSKNCLPKTVEKQRAPSVPLREKRTKRHSPEACVAEACGRASCLGTRLARFRTYILSKLHAGSSKKKMAKRTRPPSWSLQDFRFPDLYTIPTHFQDPTPMKEGRGRVFLWWL